MTGNGFWYLKLEYSKGAKKPLFLLENFTQKGIFATKLKILSVLDICGHKKAFGADSMAIKWKGRIIGIDKRRKGSRFFVNLNKKWGVLL